MIKSPHCVMYLLFHSLISCLFVCFSSICHLQLSGFVLWVPGWRREHYVWDPWEINQIKLYLRHMLPGRPLLQHRVPQVLQTGHLAVLHHQAGHVLHCHRLTKQGALQVQWPKHKKSLQIKKFWYPAEMLPGSTAIFCPFSSQMGKMSPSFSNLTKNQFLFSFQGWRLGSIQRLSVRHTHLQRVHHLGPLRVILVLLCHTGTPQALRPGPEIFHHQISHFLVILARSPIGTFGKARLHFAHVRRKRAKNCCRTWKHLCRIPKLFGLHRDVFCRHCITLCFSHFCVFEWGSY